MEFEERFWVECCFQMTESYLRMNRDHLFHYILSYLMSTSPSWVDLSLSPTTRQSEQAKASNVNMYALNSLTQLLRINYCKLAQMISTAVDKMFFWSLTICIHMGLVTSLSDHKSIVLPVANSIYIIHDLKSDEFSQGQEERIHRMITWTSPDVDLSQLWC